MSDQVDPPELSAWADELWHRSIDADSESGPTLLANALRRAAATGDAAARNAPAWVQAVAPAEIVRQRALRWPDFHPEDFCHLCGRRNPTWFADTAEWQTATGSTGDGGGVLCPSCFCALWEQATGKTAIVWRLSIDARSRDAAPEAPVCDRYWLCDDSCTTDCGTCKGAGRPAAPAADTAHSERDRCAICNGDIEWTGSRWRHLYAVVDHHVPALTTRFSDAATEESQP